MEHPPTAPICHVGACTNVAKHFNIEHGGAFCTFHAAQRMCSSRGCSEPALKGRDECELHFMAGSEGKSAKSTPERHRAPKRSRPADRAVTADW